MPDTTTPVVYAFGDPAIGSVTWTLPDWMHKTLSLASPEELAFFEQISTELVGTFLAGITLAITNGKHREALLELLAKANREANLRSATYTATTP